MEDTCTCFIMTVERLLLILFQKQAISSLIGEKLSRQLLGSSLSHAASACVEQMGGRGACQWLPHPEYQPS